MMSKGPWTLDSRWRQWSSSKACRWSGAHQRSTHHLAIGWHTHTWVFLTFGGTFLVFLTWVSHFHPHPSIISATSQYGNMSQDCGLWHWLLVSSTLQKAHPRHGTLGKQVFSWRQVNIGFQILFLPKSAERVPHITVVVWLWHVSGACKNDSAGIQNDILSHGSLLTG